MGYFQPVPKTSVFGTRDIAQNERSRIDPLMAKTGARLSIKLATVVPEHKHCFQSPGGGLTRKVDCRKLVAIARELGS
jgi:hypothetical protein